MSARAPEPVTPGPPRLAARPVLAQQWRDVVFLHWRAEADSVTPFLPAGTRPDVLDGVTYIGIVCVRIRGARIPGLPAVPYLGSFPEINVRLYSVADDGRRGVVFCSLDAARLAPALAARAALALPYMWARMGGSRRGDVVSYRSSRRWTGPIGAGLRLRLRLSEPVSEPSELEHFLTARWGLHAAWRHGRTFYLPVRHPQWMLRRAQVLELRQDLTAAAGLPALVGPPASVLYSPGVSVQAGLPQR